MRLPSRGHVVVAVSAGLLIGVLLVAASVRALRQPDSPPQHPAIDTVEQAATPAQPIEGALNARRETTAAAGAGDTSPKLSLIGSSDLGRLGGNADIALLDGVAYVGGHTGSGGCPGHGVRIVDLADPANPAVVATVAGIPGTTSEDVAVAWVQTPHFSGTLLVAGIQRCSGPSSVRGGLIVVDVTDPRDPRTLSFFDTSPAPAGVHELDLTVRNGRVLALLAAPQSERGGTGDVRIVELTDPRRPVQLAHWGAMEALGMTEGIGCVRRNAVLAHSVRASADGRRAYVSYWDAGVIILDITEPAAPRMIGRIFEADVEGNIHSVDEADGDLLLVAEEYTRPVSLRMRVESGGTVEEVGGCESGTSSMLQRTGVLAGSLMDAGDGCRPMVAGSNVIALADQSGECSVDDQARFAHESGAAALILLVDDPVMALQSPIGDPFPLPVVTAGWMDGEHMRTGLTRGPVSVTLPSSMPYGGVRVWDIRDPARPERRAVFRTENAERIPPSGPGMYTAHNPVGLGRYALVSWYNDGVRLLDLDDPTRPREIDAFVPEGGRIWGVAVEGDLVVASDMNGGLYVLRLDGMPRP